MSGIKLYLQVDAGAIGMDQMLTYLESNVRALNAAGHRIGIVKVARNSRVQINELMKIGVTRLPALVASTGAVLFGNAAILAELARYAQAGAQQQAQAQAQTQRPSEPLSLEGMYDKGLISMDQYMIEKSNQAEKTERSPDDERNEMQRRFQNFGADSKAPRSFEARFQQQQQPMPPMAPMSQGMASDNTPMPSLSAFLAPPQQQTQSQRIINIPQIAQTPQQTIADMPPTIPNLLPANLRSNAATRTAEPSRQSMNTLTSALLNPNAAVGGIDLTNDYAIEEVLAKRGVLPD